ncbi:unnamed protein product [Schistosoma curassoni]|uniref:Reverse transcriptase domain-containing protein n=1 Tax=Schistosoma curassoni TaxID=6186 RepID=A0A183JMZ1_9TREM|nr:unnamed protein product [Schistosoma curassoni]
MLKKHWTTEQIALQRFNTAFLRDTNKFNEFKIALNNRSQALQDLLKEEATTMEGNWKDIKKALTSTCQEALGLKKHHRHKECISIETLDKIKGRKNKKTAINNSRAQAEKVQAHDEYIEVNKHVKKGIKADKQKYVEELAMTAEKAAREVNMKQLYDTTKKLVGKYNKPERSAKDEEGRPITGIHERRNRWVEYFEELLNRPASLNPPDIEAAHTDLPIDIWEEEQVPMDWKEGHLIMIPKKGDLNKCENYRGITLLSVPGKVFDRVLLNRMKDAVDTQLRHQQAGFRKNRSCTDQIATLRIVVEQSIEWDSSLYTNSIDYEKAFDSVDRRTLWKLRRHYGVPEKIVNIIRNSYDELQCKVVHGGQLADAFQVRTGVRQGCLLSPFLFLLVVDWIMKTSTSEGKHRIQWTAQNQLDNLDFADDLALLPNTHEQMQIKTTSVAAASASVGLNIHKGKKKVLKCNTENTNSITFDEETLEDEESFTSSMNKEDQMQT